jgi:hypothetical protein
VKESRLLRLKNSQPSKRAVTIFSPVESLVSIRTLFGAGLATIAIASLATLAVVQSNLSVTLIPIMVAIIGALATLLVHHYQVQQEIKMRIATERFERKKQAYRRVIATMNNMIDFAFRLGQPVNWRIARQSYSELVLVGSPNVISRFNEFMKEFDKPQSDNLILDVWYAMHQDLYGESLPPGSIKFLEPGKPLLDLMQEASSWWPQIRQEGIQDWNDLEKIDEKALSKKIGAPEDLLARLKKAAADEVQREEQRVRFFECEQ